MQDGATVERGWFTRNWKWLVPTLVIAPIFFSCSCFVGGIIGIQRVVRQQPVYQQAWEQVRQHPAVITELGQPIEEGWLAQSTFEQVDGRSTVAIVFNVDGPVGEGTVQAMGVDGESGWQLTALVVHAYGGPGGEVMIPIVKETDVPAGPATP